MSPTRFNIRVYGICIEAGKLLVIRERIKGRWVVKFPGGGLELGEGIADCLIREWQEELGQEIEIEQHFYTTDFFQPSAFDDSQVISIYYLVKAKSGKAAIRERDMELHWLPVQELTAETFTLPIDKIVGQLLINSWDCLSQAQ